MDLRIAHLYPDLMNTYGDMGNIIALTKRCEWRNIPVSVHNVTLGDKVDPDFYDFYFFGGGQDWQQEVVAQDLLIKMDALQKAKENKAVFLSICGGYQLLGQYYQDFEGKKLYGAGVIDAYTKASHKRMINNLVVEIDSDIAFGLQSTVYRLQTKLVGFENHWGQTFLGQKAHPLGKVLLGNGNNGEDLTEGAIDGTAFGCYLHGSLLPKNPHFADYLLRLALQRRHGDINLSQLDDNLALEAHKLAILRAYQVKE